MEEKDFKTDKYDKAIAESDLFQAKWTLVTSLFFTALFGWILSIGDSAWHEWLLLVMFSASALYSAAEIMGLIQSGWWRKLDKEN